MLGHVFFHDTIRKYVATFGTIFNDIKLNRTNREGEVIETIGVPLTYAAQDKFVTRLQQDANLDKHVAIQLPRMSFNMIDMQYDASRMTPATNRLTNVRTPDAVNTIHSLVPYDFTFQLSIYTKTNEDGVRIVEQILPFFVPQFAPSVQLLDDPDVVQDIPIIFGGVQIQDVFDGNFEDRRILIHTMTFVMKGYMIGPKIEKKLILSANTHYRIAGFDSTGNITTSNNFIAIAENIKPGLTANGEPTSNAAESVAANTISPNSNYGYIYTYEYNDS